MKTSLVTTFCATTFCAYWLLWRDVNLKKDAPKTERTYWGNTVQDFSKVSYEVVSDL